MSKKVTSVAIFDGYGDVDQVHIDVVPRPVQGPGRHQPHGRLRARGTVPGRDPARAPRAPQVAIELRDVAELIAEWNIRMLISGFYPFVSLDRALADLDARNEAASAPRARPALTP